MVVHCTESPAHPRSDDVLGTHYRVRRLPFTGECAERNFETEDDAYQHVRWLIEHGEPHAVILLERLDTVAADGRRPRHYEVRTLSREVC